VSGQHALDALKPGVFARCVHGVHVLGGGWQVWLPGHGRVRQDGLYLGAKHQCAISPPIVEGLDAYAVARYEKPLQSPIPQGEGEHAVETVEAFHAPFLVSMKDDLGVGV
jgi:hypothetical protein